MAEPTEGKAISSLASLKLIFARAPPKLCDTQKYTKRTRNQCVADYRTASTNWPQVLMVCTPRAKPSAIRAGPRLPAVSTNDTLQAPLEQRRPVHREIPQSDSRR